MKKSIIAVLAVFLAAVLLVSAGSADNIFPYQNLDQYNTPGFGMYEGQTLYLLGQTDERITIVKENGHLTFTDLDFIPGTYTAAVGNTNISYGVMYPDANVKITLIVGTTETTSDATQLTTVSKSSGLKFSVTPKVPGYSPVGLLFTSTMSGETTYFGDLNSSDFIPADFKVNTLVANGVKSGKYTVQAIMDPADFPGMDTKFLKGHTVQSFTVAQTSNSITADKDEVIRGNSFKITLTGTPGDLVAVTIDNKGLYVSPGQSYVTYPAGYDKDVKVTAFKVLLPSEGKASVTINTNSSVGDDTYKIEATFNQPEESKESVKVVVKKGEITVVPGASSYYVGNKIKLSGINTESDSVYLYMMGTNKVLREIPLGIGSYVGAVDVNEDGTWEKEFTIYNEFDASTYTFYAVADAYPVDTAKDHIVEALDDDEKKYAYATCSVTLKAPFLTATAASAVVAKGDDIKIKGTVEGTPAHLIAYIFGSNYFDYKNISTEDDGTYEVKIKTGDLDPAQYFVVIQHPMYDKLFNVQPGDYSQGKDKADIISFSTAKDGSLEVEQYISNFLTRQKANAAQALCNLIDVEYVDDIYVKLDFQIENPIMSLNAVGDQTQGATFKVSGTTNVKVGADVTIDVISTKFQAQSKTGISSSSYLVQTTKVVAGTNGLNTFSATFDGTPLDIDAYTAIAKISDKNLQQSTTFNIVKGTVKPTTTATVAPTTTAVPTQTSTPAKTPGFGALIALAGLGAVAVLVLRRQ